MSADSIQVTGRKVTAGQIRAITSRARRQRSDKSFATVLGDVYTAFFSILISVAMMGGAVTGLERSAGSPSSGGLLRTLAPATPIPVFWAAVLMLLIGTAVTAGLLSRLGPVSASQDQAVWWLSLPVGRRAFLTPSFWRLLGMIGAAGAIGAALAGLGAGSFSLASVLTGLLGGMLLAAASVLVQSANLRRALTTVADIVAVVVPAIVLVLLLTGLLTGSELGSWALAVPALWPLLTGQPALLAFGLAAVLAVAAAVWAFARLGRFRSRELSAAGGVSSSVMSSIMTFDTRELSRVLQPAKTSRRHRHAKFAWVSSPVRALLASEITLFVRSPRRWGQLLMLACIPVLIAVIQGVLSSVAVVYLALLFSAFFAALTAVESSRQAELNPSLDRLLPLPAKSVYWVRSALPLALMAVWMVVTCWLLADVSRMSWEFILLGLATVPGFAAAGVRSAYRPAPNWSGNVVATPAGPIPLSAISSLRRGPDFALFSSLGLGVGLFLGYVPPIVLLVTLVINISLLLFTVRSPIPNKKGWMERMSEEAEKAKNAR